MTPETRRPSFILGAFVMNDRGELLLRTTPSQGGRYTCINAPLVWGKTFEETLREHVLAKTGCTIKEYTFLGLTEALDIHDPKSEDLVHMVFADYKVLIDSATDFREIDPSRTYTWRTPEEWLTQDPDIFGQYIREVIPKLI